jgi:hypothetical protein
LSKTNTLEIIQDLKAEGLDLENLSEIQIIRIEKTLKARIKLNQSLDINELESVIYLLRNKHEELVLLIHPDFKVIREIIENKEFIFFSTFSLYSAKLKGEKLKYFLKEFFFEELTSYARKCIEDGHYRALHEYLQVQTIFEEEILNNLRKQLELRFILLSETFRLHKDNKPEKIVPLMNPYLYRCINELNRDVAFDTKVNHFHSLILNSQKEISKDHFIRLIFCVTIYKPIGEEYKKLAQHNHDYAVNRGAYELSDTFNKANFKGGTSSGRVKIKDLFGSENYSIRKRSKQKQKYTWRKNWVLIIPAVLFTYYLYTNSYKNSKSDNTAERKEIINKLSNYTNITDRANNLYKDYTPNAATIHYLQDESPKIINKNPMLYTRNYFLKKSPKSYGKESNYLKITNNTPDYIILILQDKFSDSSYLVMGPGRIITVSIDLNKLNVYAGKELEEIEYLDRSGQTKMGLRFNKYYNYHRKILKENFTFSGINSTHKHSIIIFQEGLNKTEIGIKHKITINPKKRNGDGSFLGTD